MQRPWQDDVTCARQHIENANKAWRAEAKADDLAEAVEDILDALTKLAAFTGNAD